MLFSPTETCYHFWKHCVFAYWNQEQNYFSWNSCKLRTVNITTLFFLLIDAYIRKSTLHAGIVGMTWIRYLIVSAAGWDRVEFGMSNSRDLWDKLWPMLGWLWMSSGEMTLRFLTSIRLIPGLHYIASGIFHTVGLGKPGFEQQREPLQ